MSLQDCPSKRSVFILGSLFCDSNFDTDDFNSLTCFVRCTFWSFKNVLSHYCWGTDVSKWPNVLSIFLASLRSSNSMHVVLISLKLSSDWRIAGKIHISLCICICEISSTRFAHLNLSLGTCKPRPHWRLRSNWRLILWFGCST